MKIVCKRTVAYVLSKFFDWIYDLMMIKLMKQKSRKNETEHMESGNKKKTDFIGPYIEESVGSEHEKLRGDA